MANKLLKALLLCYMQTGITSPRSMLERILVNYAGLSATLENLSGFKHIGCRYSGR
jgi:hypothetical protein